MGTSVITLCTGTRDPQNMWRWHPENTSPQAWEDLLCSMGAALSIAEEENIILAFEPERANVINTAARGRALLDAMQSQHLKVIMDPANLIVSENKQQMHHILDEAFELLGEYIVLAHAKDVGPDNTFQAAGSGILDYDYYLHHLEAATVKVPLIIHGLSEAQVDATVRFLREKLQG
jgi:sugar phosphate isomerase/epimerase